MSLGVLLVLAVGVFAQIGSETPIGSRGAVAKPAYVDDSVALSPHDKARKAVADYALCVTSRHRSLVVRVFETEPGSLAEREAIHNVTAIDDIDAAEIIASGGCLHGGNLKLTTYLMRFALNQATYRVDYAKADSLIAAGPTPARWTNATGDGPSGAYATMVIFADCVVRAAPGPARALMFVGVAGNAERQAYAGLSAAMGSCVPKGVRLALDKIALPGAIAAAFNENARAAASLARAGN